MPILQTLFPKFLSQFKSGTLVHAKFVTSGTTTTVTFAFKSTVPGANFNALTLVRTGVGLYSLTLTGGAKQIAIQNITIGVPSGRVGLRFEPAVAAYIAEGTGVIQLASVNAAGATADTITAGDEVHVTLFIDK